MTLDEFRTLQVGDRIYNPMSDSTCTVNSVESTRRGVHVYVQWRGSSHAVHFTEQQTAWMHWTKQTKE
jgi:hypothetical protein